MMIPSLMGLGAMTVGAMAGISYAMFNPRSQWLGRVWTSRPDEKNRRIALTFDDGPHPQATPKVLEILGKYRAQATFFVIGRFAEEHPDLIRQIHAQGHQIANHTMDHHHLGTLHGRGYWIDQIRQTNDIIAQIIGSEPAMFRPPMGFRSPLTMQAARRLNMQTINWSLRARDGVATTSEAILRRLKNHCIPGDIVLMHDGIDPHRPRDWEPTIEALPAILEHLRDKQLHGVRVDALLGLQGYRDVKADAQP